MSVSKKSQAAASYLVEIDQRERSLWIEIEKQLVEGDGQGFHGDQQRFPFRIASANLPIGDIVIRRDGEQEEICVIERKSITDLLASIQDSRYDEQKFRMEHALPQLHNHYKIYLIEGNLGKFGRAQQKKVLSSMTSLLFHRGFSVIRTANVTETATWILQTVVKLRREDTGRKLFYQGPTPAVVEAENSIETMIETKVESVSAVAVIDPAAAPYCHVVKKVKKHNITKENIGEIMLCQIPHIGGNVATAIMREFGTIQNLVNQLKEKGSLALTHVRVGKSRLGENVVESLVSFLG